MQSNNTLAQPDNATGQTSFASPYTYKRGYVKHWQASERWVSGLLEKGLPHLKIGARRVRIHIPEADAWMQQQFRVQRRGAAR